MHTKLDLVCSVGPITLHRRYYACRDCGAKAVPLDDWAGLEKGHRLTVHARRMATLAGSTWSFDQASDKLEELCHLSVSNDVIRRVCDAEGQAARDWLRSDGAPAEMLAEAEGDVEFYTDGVQVNTVDGWREMRLSVFVKRPAGSPATPEQWKDRVLPEPSSRVGFAAIAPSHCIGSSWKKMLEHLGLDDCESLSVLGDGARWIWDEAAKRFKLIQKVDWCLDVFHATEHVHACAAEMFGPQTSEAKQWATTRAELLIELEGPAFIKKLDAERAEESDAGKVKALDGLIRYLTEHRDSLWYRKRLGAGQVIGTGLVEGACKNTIAARLKINNPRWRVRRAEHMAALRCLQYSNLWDAYWASKAA